MKTINNLLLIGAFFLFAACGDILSERPPGEPNVEDFYKNDKQIRLAVNDGYDDLWDIVFKDNLNQMYGDQPTDIIRKNSPTSLSYRDLWDWDRTTREFNDWWAGCYRPINEMNYLLDNLTDEHLSKSDVTISTEVAQQAEGEARFMRAFWYYQLVKAFGGVPIHKEPTKSIKGLNKPRNSEQEVYSFIESDLKIAEELLGPDLNVGDFQISRATVASAQALLARIYANQGKWQLAKTYATKVIDHPYVELMDDYSLIWHPDYEGSGEHIFSANHIVGGSTSALPNHQVFEVPVYGYNSEEHGPVKFALNEGLKAPMFFVSKDFYYETPDTYRKQHTMRDWMPYYIKNEKFVGDTIRFPASHCPCLVKRHVLMPDKLNRYVSVDEKLIRTSEMYLIKAEAENELNGPTATATDAINMVRSRARGDNVGGGQTPENLLPDLNPGSISKAAFRDSVITEFAREFIGEGKFRMVLRRHNMYTNSEWTDTEAKSRADYKELYPVPNTQLDRNPNLVQNEGYKGRTEPEGEIP